MPLIPYKVDVPMARWPIANFAIILATVGAFVAQWRGVGFDAFVLRDGDPAGVFGCVLVHADGWHLLGNMLLLWLFGNAVCAKVGNGKYVLLYLALTFAASMTHLLFDGGPAIGASGAVNGVIGAFLVFYPRNQVSCVWGWYVFGYVGRENGVFEVDARAVILFWLVLDIWGAVSGGEGIAYAAHLGGFGFGFVAAAGLLYTRLVVMSDTEQSLFDLVGDRASASLRRLRSEPDETTLGRELLARDRRAASADRARSPEANRRPPRGLRLRCACGNVMGIHRRHIGKRARCPQCKATFTIPEHPRSAGLSASPA